MRSFLRARRLMVAVFIALYGFLCLTAFAPTAASAAPSAANCTRESGNFLQFPTWYKFLEPRFEGGECRLNTSFPDAIPRILLAVFEIILRITGLAAVLFIIYGGFQYLTSTGEPEKAKNARTTIINALAGLVVSIFSVAIVNLVGNNIG
jgi:type IV secretion system pilin